MKTIIAGSRQIPQDVVVKWLQKNLDFTITEVVSGCCRGPDDAGAFWGKANAIPVRLFPAHWPEGKSAGPKRNQQMADYADALICFWDGFSRGTKDMIDRATQRGLKIIIVNCRLDQYHGWYARDTALL